MWTTVSLATPTAPSPLLALQAVSPTNTSVPCVDVDIIVSACGFPDPEEYSPRKDAVVNNVRVVATKPATYMGAGAGVDHSSAPAARLVSLFAVVTVASFALGATMLW